MSTRSRRHSSGKGGVPTSTTIRLDIDSWEMYRGLMRDTVLGWFVEIAREVLNIKTRSDVQARAFNIEQVIKNLLTASKANKLLKRTYLPLRTLKLQTGISIDINLDEALKKLANITTTAIRCGFSGGIPPDLTAELAEYVRGFGGPLCEKRRVFELCEDLVYLAELGAFISKIGVERRDRELIHHYIYTSALVVLEQLDVDRFKNCIRFKSLGRRLFDGHYHTLLAGSSAYIGRYLSLWKRRGQKDYVRSMLERGVVIDYLRLSRNNVLEIRGFEKLVVTEATEFFLKSGIATPFAILVSLYPTTREIKGATNRDEIKALKELREVVDTACRCLVKYLNLYTEVRSSIKGYLVVRRNLQPVYEVMRRLGLFIESLESDRKIRDILNARLKSRFRQKKQQELDIAELTRAIVHRLGVYVQRGGQI